MKHFLLFAITLYSSQSMGFLIPIHSNITKETLTEEQMGFDESTALDIASYNTAIDLDLDLDADVTVNI